MTIIVFLIDTSASMLQRTYIGGRTTLLDVAKSAVETFVKIRQRSMDSRIDRYMLLTFEDTPNNIKAGQHLKKEYLKTVSKIPRVPVIHDSDFRLNESVAIVRYLCRQYPIADQWYPKDSKKQAKIDEYLEWHHLNVRLNCATYFITKWATPLRKGTQPTEEQLRKTKKYMEISLKNFEDYFLSNSGFINGEQIAYSDIHAACEIEQTRIAGYDARDYFPKIKKWIEDVRQECNPYYDEAHEYVNMLSENQEEETPKSKL